MPLIEAVVVKASGMSVTAAVLAVAEHVDAGLPLQVQRLQNGAVLDLSQLLA